MNIGKNYYLHQVFSIWINNLNTSFSFSDGDAAENYIYELLKGMKDVSCASDTLVPSMKDWPSEYHLSPDRHNLFSPLQIKAGTTILELGCGMGAITRYLGEIGAHVTAVEGSIRRAAITKERCRDLKNVTVVCDNFKNLEAGEKYDIVTLIGVFEYSPKFIGGPDPFDECLSIVKKHLKPDGFLVMAIENRTGLKYFNGLTEDHTGGTFDSIHDNYPADTVKTFGYEEIKSVLAMSGFISTEFLFPFPDYKLPTGSSLVFLHDKVESAYVSGSLMSDEIAKLFLLHDPYESLIEKFSEYKDFVSGLSGNNLFDCTPFNIIRSDQKTLNYIDDEWVIQGELPLRYIIIRGIYYMLLEKIDLINSAQFLFRFASLRDICSDIFKRLGMDINNQDIDYFCRKESEIQTQIGYVNDEERLVV